MQDVPYREWAERVALLAARAGWSGGSVLELGCGTAMFSERFVERASSWTGIDSSLPMLQQAEQKGLGATFLQRDMRDLSGLGPFSLALAIFDVVNNLLEDGALAELAAAVHGVLQPGGVWVFDVNTGAGLIDPWEGEDQEGWVGEVHYRWRHRFDASSGLAHVEANFAEGLRRFSETHTQRPYEGAELSELLAVAGFSEVALYDHEDLSEPDATTPRLWVVACKGAPARL